MDSQSFEVIKTIFDHRLSRKELDRILAAMVAIENDITGKTGDLFRRVSQVVDIANQVSDLLSLDELLFKLMDVISWTLNADRATLFLNDADNGELFSRIATKNSIDEIRLPNKLGIAGNVFTSGHGEIIPDVYRDPRFKRSVDEETGYRTRNILCTPIRNGQKIIGVTQVINKLDGDFTFEDLQLLEVLTAQVAATLQNAHLFEKTERAKKEETQMLEMTSALASELDLDNLLGKIIGAITDILDADRSTLFLHDPRSNQLWSRVAQGLESKVISFPADKGIAGASFTAGEIINIPDAYQDSRFNPEIDKRMGYTTRTILCVPVRNKDGSKLGVVQVLNKNGGPFTANDERRLMAFSAQAAIALENATLFAEVNRERNYNESILKSLSNGVITLDVDNHIIKVNEAALKTLELQTAQVLHEPVESFFQHPSAHWLLDSLKRVGSTGKTDIAMDSELTLDSGKVVSMNLSTVPLIDVKKQERIGSMLVIDDISGEKRIKTTMARYMAKEIVDKLLQEEEDALGGNAQVASVLFSDIRKFTTISEELGPKETVSMLNDYLTVMVDAIFKHEGILDKYIGDAIMALFGAPFASDRDADNALSTANEMIHLLNEFNARRRKAGKQEIDIGVGVSTGELIAGNIGSPKRMEYTVIGDTVNLAARLESATKYYGVKVLFSEQTRESLTNHFHYREVDLIQVKGKSEPSAIYEALDHHDERSFPHRNEVLSAFGEGLSRYRRGDWPEALGCFEAVLQARPQDRPSRLYIERCQHFMVQPPEPDWRGVWVMQEK